MPKAHAEVFDKDRLASDLRTLGIGAGDLVIVHSSLKAVGRIEPDASAMVEALVETIGPDGTLLVPTLVPALRGLRPLFERDVTPSEMGLLTEKVRKWPGTVRSNHQTHSVAALGPLANEITQNHESAWGPNSPWGPKALGFGTPWDELYSRNAWVLLIGVGFNRCTILHHAQARYKAAHEGVTKETPWPDFDFLKMGDHLESAGAGPVWKAWQRRVPAHQGPTYRGRDRRSLGHAAPRVFRRRFPHDRVGEDLRNCEIARQADGGGLQD